MDSQPSQDSNISNSINNESSVTSNVDLNILNKPKPINSKRIVFVPKRVILTTKKAVELLLNGSITKKVCRYCLHITSPLSELNQILHIGTKEALYRVTIRDVVASFHPFKVTKDPNFPNKICEICLNKALQAYLFAQQCEQSERALRNCFDDMFNKLEKLDPLERTSKRGRQKLNPNFNILYTEHLNVINYAEPLRHLINAGTQLVTKANEMSELECKRCWQVMPDLESLANHEKIHPNTMWYHCRICGKSFARKFHINKHLKLHSRNKNNKYEEEKIEFVCQQCGVRSTDYNLHLQHMEKHKFKMVLQHLIEKKMDKLCTVCFDKTGKMVGMDNMICLNGGYPELNGDHTLINILGSILPKMNSLHNYLGCKICDKCLDNAITSYIFIYKANFIRSRLNTCITKMLENLKDVSTNNKLLIEVSQNGIMPVAEGYDINLLLSEDEVDEYNLKFDVLEDEFRIKSSSESSSEDDLRVGQVTKNYSHDLHVGEVTKKYSREDLHVGQVTRKYSRDNIRRSKSESHDHDPKLTNGYLNSDNLNEFLTFKKKTEMPKKIQYSYVCPVCDKKFISDFFLKRHVTKHANKKVKCKVCRNSFDSKFYLREHYKVVHLLKLERYSICNKCGRSFKNDLKLQFHLKTHISKQCEICSKYFASQFHYDSHMQRHIAKIRALKQSCIQTCSFCEKEYSNDDDLSFHVNKTHLQIKPHHCDMCDRQFYSESDLSQHKRLHSVRSREKCELCSKFLKSRKDLVVHIRKHMGQKPYRCQICAKRFYSELEIKSHMKVLHANNYYCKQCKKVCHIKEHRLRVNRAITFFP